MGLVRTSLSSAIFAALLATSVTPVFAEHGYGGGYGYGNGYGGYDSYGGNRHRGRHHDRIDAGDVIAGIAIFGVIAAIASAASKPKAQKRYPDNADSRYPNNDQRAQNPQRGSINTENAAVDACATAAEDRGGQSASVREITTVNANSDGWDVEGVIEQRDGWRDRSADRKRFTCSVRYGSVDGVYIDKDAVALR